MEKEIIALRNKLRIDKELMEKTLIYLKDNDIFYYDILKLKAGKFNNLIENNYNQLDYNLKSIHQDIKRILTIINKIEETKLESFKSKNLNTFVRNELSCYIDYLFIKYRVIIEYFEKIITICILPNLTPTESQKYHQEKKKYKKNLILLNFLKNYSATNFNSSFTWFEEIRQERNSIIHEGAGNFILDSNDELLFKVWKIDELDQEVVIVDPFYSDKNGFFYYEHYWALELSKLILFGTDIFQSLFTLCTNPDEIKTKLTTSDCYPKNREIYSETQEMVPHPQDIVEKMIADTSNKIENILNNPESLFKLYHSVMSQH